MKNHTLHNTPEISKIMQDADHIDVKTIEGEASLTEFIAGMIGYQPPWITFLYGIRFFFVRLLGMKQGGIPQPQGMRPEDVSMIPGDKLSFFTVKAAKAGEYWIAGITESHLTAHLAIAMEPLTEKRNRFSVITIVHYHRWTGPVYFNVIRPFHHLVVSSMMKGGVAAA